MSNPYLSQLQRPAFAVVNGELVAYDDVKVHISAEALTRALSVFEGMKGYWDLESREFGVRNRASITGACVAPLLSSISQSISRMTSTGIRVSTSQGRS
jgi:hypothetical protein